MSDDSHPTGGGAGVVLIDAHGLIYQVFHAIRQPMSAPDGRPTNAVFGLLRDLLYLREERKPEYLICTLDPPVETFRKQLYDAYKANRSAPPGDLQLQWPAIRELIAAFNVPLLEVPGYEADDVIATVAVAAAGRGLSVDVCSSDKDCRQLISDRVRVFNLRKRTALDRQGLIDEWGVTPEQVIDYQTLVGDGVDNVPGVKGVGEKTAAKLLQQFGSLDNLVKNADTAGTPKVRAALKEAAASGQLELARKLVTLDTNVPLAFDWEGWKLRDPDVPRLQALLNGLGIRQFNRSIGALAKGAPPPPAPAEGPPADGDTDFPFGALASSENAWKGDYRLVDTPAAFDAFLKDLKTHKRFAIDLETTGLDPLRGEIVGFAVSWSEGLAYYLPVRGPEGEKKLDPAATVTALKPLLEDPTVEKVNQNVKFDQLVLRRHGVRLAGVAGDPMVADYLLHAGERSHNLDDMALRYLNHENITITDLIGKKGKNQKTIDQVEIDRVREYAGEDADVAWRLTEKLEEDLRDQKLISLYNELEVPLIEVLAEMEFNGVRVDADFLGTLGGAMAQQLQGIERDIYAIAGHEFNIGSPKQLRTVLFDELKLPAQKRTELTGEVSTDQETLEKLSLVHELPRKIIEYRQVSKLKGTYVDALPALVNPETGRVHTSFNQTVAATGRLSSSEPNLQNVPARTDQGRQIRQAFVPEAGWLILTADYSQIELRLLAHFCGDDELRAAFAEDRDIHTAVAAEIFKVAPAEVTSDQRRKAKTVNFGVIYGISPHGLAVRLGIGQKEAAQFIDSYFARFPKVAEYQAGVLKRCQTDGYVGTILGRRRAFDRSAIRPTSTYQHRNGAEREAINMEIQGSAADLMKKAMLAVHRRLKAEGRRAKMLLSVHDELVFEVPPDELKPVAAAVRAEMVGAMGLTVPLQVDVAAGPNWLDVAEVA